MSQQLTEILTPRWTKLNYHAVQQQLWGCQSRFIVVPSGRRSGKTEFAKRKLVMKAITYCHTTDGRFLFSAPTQGQAKEIFWADAKRLVPAKFLRTPRYPWKSISESQTTIHLWNGARIQVLGMDKAERAEGSPIDGIVLDEYGNMKATVWTEHIRPALSTLGRPGWCWFIGVPEGRNHYYNLFRDCARRDNWSGFTWPTADINPKEAMEARAEMDPLTYQQEYEAMFITFEGRAYYAFDSELHCPPRGVAVKYDPRKDLNLCFDFNNKPGVAVAVQELPSPDWLKLRNGGENVGLVSAAVGEIWLPNFSNTYRVCEAILERYRGHKGDVNLYGDASGGARSASAVKGSDWELVQEKLRPVFGDQMYKKVPKANPSVRSRLNSVNKGLKDANQLMHTIIDRRCEHLIDDFDGVAVNDAGNEILDKDTMLTHISDGWGYYQHKAHPCREAKTTWSYA